MTPSPNVRFFLVAAALLSLPLCHAADTAHALFNGRDLAGWEIVNGGRFSVEDGVLKIDRGTGWLRSDDEFRDFTLILELRFLEANANSGIFVRTGPTSKADENGWPDNGYQVQCMDTAEGANPIGAVIFYGASEFEQVFDRAVIADAKKPAGEWNRMEITCRGEHLAVRLNGTLIVLAQGILKPSGHVGLQAEHGPLEFRRIEIVEHSP